MADVLILQDRINKKMLAAKTPFAAPERFSRESRLWLGLGRHPNIVRAHTVHNVKETPFLFMDFIGDSLGNSRNLRNVLKEALNKLELAIKSVIATTRALQYANSIFPGFVHRDLKPENLLIDEDGNPYVSDFGIGHIPKQKLVPNRIKIKNANNKIIEGNTIFTEVGSFVGTPGYASPEQYFDSSHITFKSDIYSLGIILFEALTGTLPFSVEALENDGINLMKLPLTIPPNQKSEVQISLWNIVLKMLSFDPNERYSSLEQVEKELFKLKDHDSFLELDLNNDEQYNKGLTKTTFINRVHSLIELEEYQLATSALFNFKKKFPLSTNVPLLINKLFMKLPSNANWNFLKEATHKDFSNPISLILFLLSGLIMISPLCFALSISLIQFSEFIMATLLLSILSIEKYINSRTAITLDKITLPGIISGILLTALFQIFNHKSLAGSTLYSIVGALIGLSIPFGVAWVYYLTTKKEGLGGGTIKLLAMIGSWTGLMILPIIIIFIILTVTFVFVGSLFVKSTSELKWSQEIICPKLLWVSRTLPTSTAILISTWLVISQYCLKHFFTAY